MRTNPASETIGRAATREANATGGSAGTRRIPAERAKLPTEVRESLWLDEVRKGTDAPTIARREQLSVRLVQMGLTRAGLRELAKARGRIPAAADSVGGASRPSEFGSRPDAKTMPRLVPLFPVGPFTPTTLCGHRHPIRAGSVFCCMVCHASGLDNHPGLKRDPKTDPSPEPVEPASPTARIPKSTQPSSSRPRMKQFARKRTAAALAS